MRLIDAEETIRSIVTTSYSENDEAIKATAKAIVAIEHSPTIVEFEGNINKVIVKGEEYHRIVRCKDCKYYHKEWDGTEKHHHEDYWCEWVEPDENDFCSLAERRSDV